MASCLMPRTPSYAPLHYLRQINIVICKCGSEQRLERAFVCLRAGAHDKHYRPMGMSEVLYDLEWIEETHRGGTPVCLQCFDTAPRLALEPLPPSDQRVNWLGGKDAEGPKVAIDLDALFAP